MSETRQNNDNFDILYGNARIRQVENDPLAGTLMIRAVFAEGEEQKILYQDVLYSQIDPTAEGRRIAIVVELTPEQLRGSKHRHPAARFVDECGLSGLGSLEEMVRRGYRLFSHFIGQSDELIVVAKSLRIT